MFDDRIARSEILKGLITGSIDWSFISAEETEYLQVQVQPPAKVEIASSDQVQLLCLGTGKGNLNYQWFVTEELDSFDKPVCYTPEITIKKDAKENLQTPKEFYCKIFTSEEEVLSKPVSVSFLDDASMRDTLEKERMSLKRNLHLQWSERPPEKLIENAEYFRRGNRRNYPQLQNLFA